MNIDSVLPDFLPKGDHSKLRDVCQGPEDSEILHEKSLSQQRYVQDATSLWQDLPTHQLVYQETVLLFGWTVQPNLLTAQRMKDRLLGWHFCDSKVRRLFNNDCTAGTRTFTISLITSRVWKSSLTFMVLLGLWDFAPCKIGTTLEYEYGQSLKTGKRSYLCIVTWVFQYVLFTCIFCTLPTILSLESHLFWVSALEKKLRIWDVHYTLYPWCREQKRTGTCVPYECIAKGKNVSMYKCISRMCMWPVYLEKKISYYNWVTFSVMRKYL